MPSPVSLSCRVFISGRSLRPAPSFSSLIEAGAPRRLRRQYVINPASTTRSAEVPRTTPTISALPETIVLCGLVEEDIGVEVAVESIGVVEVNIVELVVVVLDISSVDVGCVAYTLVIDDRFSGLFAEAALEMYFASKLELAFMTPTIPCWHSFPWFEK
jgi:hypothetical protein